MSARVISTPSQIADPDLAHKYTFGEAPSIRPCVLCNQGCQVRDVRNPLVSCTVNRLILGCESQHG